MSLLPHAGNNSLQSHVGNKRAGIYDTETLCPPFQAIQYIELGELLSQALRSSKPTQGRRNGVSQAVKTVRGGNRPESGNEGAASTPGGDCYILEGGSRCFET